MCGGVRGHGIGATTGNTLMDKQNQGGRWKGLKVGPEHARSRTRWPSHVVAGEQFALPSQDWACDTDQSSHGVPVPLSSDQFPVQKSTGKSSARGCLSANRDNSRNSPMNKTRSRERQSQEGLRDIMPAAPAGRLGAPSLVIGEGEGLFLA